MCEGQVKVPNLKDRFFLKLTIGELQRLGFERVIDLSGRSTTLRSRAPFMWAHPDALEECEYDEQLMDVLERPQTDGHWWLVVAHGVLGEGDVFPFALFPIRSTEKPIERTTSAVREMKVSEVLRKQFEDGVFAARFISSVSRSGQGGPFELQSTGCPTKASLMERSEEGDDYVDEVVSAMWFGFKLALRDAPRLSVDANGSFGPVSGVVGSDQRTVSLSSNAAAKLSSLARAMLYHLVDGVCFELDESAARSVFSPFVELMEAGFAPVLHKDDVGELVQVCVIPSKRVKAVELIERYDIKDGRRESLQNSCGLRADLPPLAKQRGTKADVAGTNS